MENEVKVFLPKLGESILGATIVQWLKKEGEVIDIDEPLVEVATDKVNSEIPSPVKGFLKEKCAKEDEELKVGDLLAVIQTKEMEKTFEEKPEEKKILSKPKTEPSKKFFLSPLAKILIKEHHLSDEEIKQIPATGAGGRISRKDIELYLKNKKPLTDISIKMNPMRKSIAKNLLKASLEIPSASLIVQIDITEILKLIEENKEAFFAKNKTKLTITAFLAKAIACAVKAYPHLNASVQEDTIFLKKEVNLGIAVSVTDGLVVPVIKNCEGKSITQLAQEVSYLGKKAREGSLSLEDFQEGTITMSNFGMGGALIGIPIIKHPEVAIIGIGCIEKKMVIVKDSSFTVRDMVMVSLTFDHRIVDGMYGCNFMKEMKDYLESKAIKDFS